eukprot:6185042-Pleurochrysis_carterae.AAC.3
MTSFRPTREHRENEQGRVQPSLQKCHLDLLLASSTVTVVNAGYRVAASMYRLQQGRDTLRAHLLADREAHHPAPRARACSCELSTNHWQVALMLLHA